MPARMPKEIHTFLKSSAFEQVTYGFMVSLVNIEGYTIRKAAEECIRYLGLDEDTCPLLSLEVLYKRKHKQFIQATGDNSDVII